MKDTIKIDGIEYVKKGKKNKKQKKKEYEYYSVKSDNKITEELLKTFTPIPDKYMSEEEAVKSQGAIFDPANVLMVMAKTERAKMILRKFVNVDATTRIPDLKYSLGEEEKKTDEIKSKYGLQYLQVILRFFEAYDEIEEANSLVFKMKKDYPLSVSNSDFEFLLAPRVE